MMTVGPFASRRLLIALPALTVAVLIGAFLGPARERGVRAARLYGGPTLGAPRPTFRLELVESRQGIARLTGSRNIDVVARTPEGHEAAWSGSVPASGVVDVELPALPPASVQEVVVAEGERELARGKLALDSETWSRGATRRGGFVEPKHPPGVDFRIGVERGVLAVPFPDRLLLTLRSVQGNEQGLELELEPSGADLSASRVVTDALGQAAVGITPREHNVSVRVQGVVGRERLSASVALPVVPGAIDARRAGDKILVRSPVPRESVFVTLVTERYRWFGVSLALVPDSEGAGAEFLLPPLPDEPVWAVTSSAVDLESPARVGWPINRQASEARHTFDVPERLQIDGLPFAERRELARQKRVRWVVVALCAVALLLELLLFARHSAESQADLERHFAKSGLSGDGAVPLGARRGAVAVAVLVVALAFVLLAVFAFLAEP